MHQHPAILQQLARDRQQDALRLARECHARREAFDLRRRERRRRRR